MPNTTKIRAKSTFTVQEKVTDKVLDKQLDDLIKKYLLPLKSLKHFTFQARLPKIEPGVETQTTISVSSSVNSVVHDFDILSDQSTESELERAPLRSGMQSVSQKVFDEEVDRLFQAAIAQLPPDFSALKAYIKTHANKIEIDAPNNGFGRKITLYPNNLLATTEHHLPYTKKMSFPSKANKNIPNGNPTDLGEVLANLQRHITGNPSELRKALNSEFTCAAVLKSEYEGKAYDAKQKFGKGSRAHTKDGLKRDVIQTHEVRPTLEALVFHHRNEFDKLLAVTTDVEAKKALLDFSNMNLSGSYPTTYQASTVEKYNKDQADYDIELGIAASVTALNGQDLPPATQRADFTSIDLQYANFSGADTKGAIFTPQQQEIVNRFWDKSTKATVLGHLDRLQTVGDHYKLSTIPSVYARGVRISATAERLRNEINAPNALLNQDFQTKFFEQLKPIEKENLGVIEAVQIIINKIKKACGLINKRTHCDFFHVKPRAEVEALESKVPQPSAAA